MRHDHEFHRFVAQGRYRPPRQWLNYPGSGPTIRPRPAAARRWRPSPLRLGIFLLAAALAVVTWSELAGR